MRDESLARRLTSHAISCISRVIPGSTRFCRSDPRPWHLLFISKRMLLICDIFAFTSLNRRSRSGESERFVSVMLVWVRLFA